MWPEEEFSMRPGQQSRGGRLWRRQGRVWDWAQWRESTRGAPATPRAVCRNRASSSMEGMTACCDVGP